MKFYFVYMVTSKRYGTLYTGITDDLNKRAWQHREHVFKGSFSDKYNCEMLVWFEAHDTREDAFVRERRIKKWRRNWKNELVDEMNPEWRDLAENLL
ncbi:MAG: GIY-YIG nuclease family protein [Pseudomonadota bacterium]